MAIAESWHVRSRSRECSATQRAFADGESIITALFPDPESSGYVRRDFCEDAWKERLAAGETPFSFWKTRFVAPTGNENVNPVEKLSAEEILQRLVEEDEDHTENARFILAVMLERQKLLRETDSQQTPSGILRVYEHRKTGEVFIVKDPNIPLSEIEAVQNEVFILLENNGRTPTPEEVIPDLPAEGGETAEVPSASEETPQEVITDAAEEKISGEAEQTTPDDIEETISNDAEETISDDADETIPDDVEETISDDADEEE